MDDARLREAYAHLQARKAAEAGRHGIPLDRIRSLAEGRVTGEERAALLDAVLADPDARREYDLLRELAAGPERAPRRYGWIAAAAVIALAALLSVDRLADRAPELMRGAGDGVVLVAPADGAGMRSGERFIWRPVRGAGSYVLEVAAEDGEPVYRSTSGDTVMALPDTVSPAGGPLRWWVIAELEDGGEARSPVRALNPQ